MAEREKISSVYISRADKDDLDALTLFREQKDNGEHAYSHSDLYRAGLGLFKANPSLVKHCKLLTALELDNDNALIAYLSQSLGVVNDDSVREYEFSTLERESLERGIAQLTEVINRQNSMLRDLLSRGEAVKSAATNDLRLKSSEPNEPSTTSSNSAVNSDGSLKLESVTKESVPTSIKKRKPPTNFCS